MTLPELMIGVGITVIVLAGVTSIGGGCSTDESQAIRALETNGFTENTILDSGYWGGWHGCSEKEMWYESQSKNSLGKPVKVVVCCGKGWISKGCTVRTK